MGAFLKTMRQFAPEVELGVAFEWRREATMAWGDNREGITLYPMRIFANKWSVLKKNIFFEQESALLLPELRQAVADFRPDVIHCFGSENALGIICGHTEIPSAIHIQGFLPSYELAKYPPGMSAREDLPSFWRHPLWHFWRKHLVKIYHLRAEREMEFLKHCQLVMGRTHWDRAIARLYAPQAKYHYVSEVLREEFYQQTGRWKTKAHDANSPYTIVSVISLPLFKGPDVILKTAQELHRQTSLNLIWRVYGIP
ncbi:MAG: hypothetical protein PHC30_03245, partial [Lentisphaeria bacterium]|nr:hypothetical protein [Lentisphaeria bacterium]